MAHCGRTLFLHMHIDDQEQKITSMHYFLFGEKSSVNPSRDILG